MFSLVTNGVFFSLSGSNPACKPHSVGYFVFAWLTLCRCFAQEGFVFLFGITVKSPVSDNPKAKSWCWQTRDEPHKPVYRKQDQQLLFKYSKKIGVHYFWVKTRDMSIKKMPSRIQIRCCNVVIRLVLRYLSTLVWLRFIHFAPRGDKEIILFVT